MESNYKLSGEEPSYLTRILTSLRTYTIGSCNYSSCHSCAKSSEGVKLNVKDNMCGVYSGGQEEEEEWEKRACQADKEMKKRLRYHFKSHIEKWTDENRRRFPWKLILHVLLLAIVTVQVSS